MSLKPTLLTLLLTSTALAAPADLTKRAPETIYLSNCVTTGSAYSKSGMFYYSASEDSQNGAPPSSGNYATVNGGSLVGWEGASVSGTFGSGVTFTSQIEGGAHAAYSYSGSGSNGYRSFACYRDNERLLFAGSEKWGKCYSVYYCL
ncbi:hypothetical protein BDW42DRAFT_128906 [Aspergillus taichungensis]|uniref:Uncharacterized protein n=1 Tax=Aspergillus taichungensis TaxID=482145 RepID=A0A2J5HPY0_9EURO|nr:hypothetical protein BDW42DRAFT_128906 [Aspergillus taichungensis]